MESFLLLKRTSRTADKHSHANGDIHPKTKFSGEVSMDLVKFCEQFWERQKQKWRMIRHEKKRQQPDLERLEWGDQDGGHLLLSEFMKDIGRRGKGEKV